MTEIDTYRPQQLDPVQGNGNGIADPTGGRLVAWAKGLEAAHRIGTALCSTAFAPAHFKNKPDDAAAAILYGDEIGLSPTQSLRSIFLISGTPGMYARQMVALVLFRGHQVWTIEKSDTKVTVAGQRRGSSHVIEETWTLARATKAGYASNKKYQTDPSSMLYARAAADVCRQIAPDALAGLAVTVEELEISAPQPTTTVRRAEPTKTTAKRSAPTPQPEPDLDPPTLAANEPIPPDPAPAAAAPPAAAGSDTTGTITAKQQKALHAGLNEAGLGERVAGLAFISDVLDREIESTKTLSVADASRVIDELKSMVENPFPPEPPLEEGS